MVWGRVAALGLVIGALSGQVPPPRYAAGQVWEYHTRPQDAGSLLKVQRIEMDGPRKVYHISVIGVHFSTPGIVGILPHLPVSDQTLDASVIRLSDSTAEFPTTALDEGIAEWRRANGGVFTIPLAEAIDFADQTIAKSPPSADPPTGS